MKTSEYTTVYRVWIPSWATHNGQEFCSYHKTYEGAKLERDKHWNRQEWEDNDDLWISLVDVDTNLNYIRVKE